MIGSEVISCASSGGNWHVRPLAKAALSDPTTVAIAEYPIGRAVADIRHEAATVADPLHTVASLGNCSADFVVTQGHKGGSLFTTSFTTFSGSHWHAQA